MPSYVPPVQPEQYQEESKDQRDDYSNDKEEDALQKQQYDQEKDAAANKMPDPPTETRK